MITKLISLEYRRHIALETSERLNEYERTQFIELAKGTASAAEYQLSLQTLSSLLHKHYGEKAIVIIHGQHREAPEAAGELPSGVCFLL